MEQNIDTGVPMTPTVDNKQKSGSGLKIATAIACVVAACGIGFGVYGMMQSLQKDSQISDLKVQIKEDDGTITTIETPEIETTTNNGATVTITDTANLPSGEKYIVKSITSTNKGEHILQIYLYSCNNTNIPVTETEEAVKQWVTDIGDDVDYFTYNVRTGYCEGDAI